MELILLVGMSVKIELDGRRRDFESLELGTECREFRLFERQGRKFGLRLLKLNLKGDLLRPEEEFSLVLSTLAIRQTRLTFSTVPTLGLPGTTAETTLESPA